MMDSYRYAFLALHFVFYVALHFYVLGVLFQIPWKLGFYGLNAPNPNSFIYDPYTFIWGLAALQMINVVVPPTFMWKVADFNAHERRTVYEFVIIICGLANLFIFIVLIVLIFFQCNNGVTRNVACDISNMTLYCLKFANDSPQGCPIVPSVPGTPTDTANFQIPFAPNPIYWWWVIVDSVFVALGLGFFIGNNQLGVHLYQGNYYYDYDDDSGLLD